MVISEAEWSSLRNYGWLRSPRYSDDESAWPSTFGYHDAVKPQRRDQLLYKYIYNCFLKVACSFVHCAKSDQASGKRVILSGIFRDSIESIPWVNGFRTGIHRVMLPHKVLIHKFLKLYHEALSANPFYVSDSLLNIIQNTQVRLTERVLALIRRFHPRLEQLIICNGELRQALKHFEFSPSWTV